MAQLQHEVQRLRQENSPQASFLPTTNEDEMKLQIINVTKYLTETERGKKSISFFNELATKKKKLCSKIQVQSLDLYFIF